MESIRITTDMPRPPVSPPNGRLVVSTNAPPTPATHGHAAALRRIGDCYGASIEQEDPLNAALGACNADLLWIGAYVQAAIKDYLKDGLTTMDKILTVKPAVDTVLQLARQVDRFSQIELQEGRRQDAGNSPTGG